MSKRIYILAPNDRFNYGDLIFPYILKKYLSDIVADFVFCSTTESNLSELGGIETKGFDILYKMSERYDNHLIIAGGESLFVPWWPILSYVDRKANWIQFQINRLYFHIGIKIKIPIVIRDRFIDYILRPIFKYRTKYPFTINKFDIKNLSGLYYNSVGNVNLIRDNRNISDENKKYIYNADYISIRDKETSNYLQALGVNHIMAPDSAILMSDIFSEDFLIEKIRPQIKKEYIDINYIFFQINLVTWENNKKNILEQIRLILEKTEFFICLCPIGTATGHEDEIALTDIYNHFRNNCIKKVKKPTLWEIMWLIKHAQLYIGTSLHGVITSQSFHVQYIAHSVNKVKAYLETWSKNIDKHFCNVQEIATYALDAIQYKSFDDIERQKEVARQSIKIIHDKILGKKVTN